MTTSTPPPAAEVRVAEFAATVNTALIAGWDAIRERHPQVPAAVMTMATGGRESATKLAHFHARRWRARGGTELHHEVFVTAESLEDGAPEVFHSLLHEAAHALNEARGVNDCSASQYHNKAYKAAADELGLGQKEGLGATFRKKSGFAGTELTEETAAVYADVIATIDAAIRATRVRAVIRQRTSSGPDGSSGLRDEGNDSSTDAETGTLTVPEKPEKEERNYAKAVCGCTPPSVIRVSPRTLARRSILCGDCTEVFTTATAD